MSFTGKRVIACTEAIEHFKTILGRIGGPEEQRRGSKFLEKIEEVEGVDLFEVYLRLFYLVVKFLRLRLVS